MPSAVFPFLSTSMAKISICLAVALVTRLSSSAAVALAAGCSGVIGEAGGLAVGSAISVSPATFPWGLKAAGCSRPASSNALFLKLSIGVKYPAGKILSAMCLAWLKANCQPAEVCWAIFLTADIARADLASKALAELY